jgi:TPR repeat protein
MKNKFYLLLVFITLTPKLFFAQSLEELKHRASNGSPEAMNKLGYNYENGIGVEVNYQLAIYWWEKASELGHKVASHNMGIMYRDGKGVNVSYDKAFYYFSKGASKGFTDSMVEVGNCYEEGKGVVKNYNLARKYFEDAIEIDNNKVALNQLGLLYIMGNGVNKDRTTAIYYWKKSCEQGYSVGCDNYYKATK